MDMDSTLITIECIDEIADMMGLKKQVAEITEAANGRMCGRGGPTAGDFGRRAMLLSPRIAPRSASQCVAQKNSPRRRRRVQGSQAGLRELSGTTAMQCEGMDLVAQAPLAGGPENDACAASC